MGGRSHLRRFRVGRVYWITNSSHPLIQVRTGILLSVAYGTLADRIGRKPCLQLCTLGMLLSEVWTRVVCKLDSAVAVRYHIDVED